LRDDGAAHASILQRMPRSTDHQPEILNGDQIQIMADRSLTACTLGDELASSDDEWLQSFELLAQCAVTKS
jgi:hypothetical protein